MFSSSYVRETNHCFWFLIYPGSCICNWTVVEEIEQWFGFFSLAETNYSYINLYPFLTYFMTMCTFLLVIGLWWLCFIISQVYRNTGFIVTCVWMATTVLLSKYFGGQETIYYTNSEVNIIIKFADKYQNSHAFYQIK